VAPKINTQATDPERVPIHRPAAAQNRRYGGLFGRHKFAAGQQRSGCNTRSYGMGHATRPVELLRPPCRRSRFGSFRLSLDTAISAAAEAHTPHAAIAKTLQNQIS